MDRSLNAPRAWTIRVSQTYADVTAIRDLHIQLAVRADGRYAVGALPGSDAHDPHAVGTSPIILDSHISLDPRHRDA